MMKSLLISCFFLQPFATVSFGQESLKSDTLLVSGLKIESPRLFIPWGISCKDLFENFSPLGIYKSPTKGKHYVLKLDSVRVFNGIRLNLILNGNYNCFFCKKDERKIFKYVDAYSFDDSTFRSLRDHFKKFTLREEVRSEWENGAVVFGYYLQNCLVRLGTNDRLLRGNYLMIQWKGE